MTPTATAFCGRFNGPQRALMAVALVSCWVAAAAAVGDEGPDTVVIFGATMFEETKAAARELNDLGAEVFDVFPPRVYFVKIPPRVRRKVQDRRSELGIESIHTGPLEPGQLVSLGPDVRAVADVWNELLRAVREDTPNRREVSIAFKEKMPQKKPPPNPLLTMTRTGMHSPPFGSVQWTLSEFMIGNPPKVPNILVNIIFPESDGSIDPNLNTWTLVERDAALAKVVAACNWWKVRAPPLCLQLSFMYSTFYVSTGYEPLLHTTGTPTLSPPCWGDGGHGLWISDVIDKLYPPATAFSCYFDKVVAFSDARRINPKIDTDWSLTVFIVHDAVDPSGDNNGNGFAGDFPDGAFAYAYLGGPFLVMTRRNDGYGQINMDAVCAHEIGHSFWALDEYCGAFTPTDRSGYLDIINSNHEGLPACIPPPPLDPCSVCPPPPTGVPCIMRGGVAPFTSGSACAFTRQMIGWRDTDGDGKPDITDTFPAVAFTSVPPIPTAMTMLSYAGISLVTTIPNVNSQPWSTNLPMTVNTITSVIYTIDTPVPPPSFPAAAVVPPFDYGFEPFSFTAGPVSPNAFHTIRAFAECTTGCLGQIHRSAPATHTVTVTFPLPPVTTCP